MVQQFPDRYPADVLSGDMAPMSGEPEAVLREHGYDLVGLVQAAQLQETDTRERDVAWARTLTDLVSYGDEAYNPRHGHVQIRGLMQPGNSAYRDAFGEALATLDLSAEVCRELYGKLAPTLVEARLRYALHRQEHAQPKAALRGEQNLLYSHLALVTAMYKKLGVRPEGKAGLAMAYVDFAAEQKRQELGLVTAPPNRASEAFRQQFRALLAQNDVLKGRELATVALRPDERPGGKRTHEAWYKVVAQAPGAPIASTVLGEFSVPVARSGTENIGLPGKVEYDMRSIGKLLVATVPAAALSLAVAAPTAAESLPAPQAHSLKVPRMAATTLPAQVIPMPRQPDSNVSFTESSQAETAADITARQLMRAVRGGDANQITQTVTAYMTQQHEDQEYVGKKEATDRFHEKIAYSSAAADEGTLDSDTYKANIANVMVRINNPDIDLEHTTDEGLRVLLDYIKEYANDLPTAANNAAYRQITVQELVQVLPNGSDASLRQLYAQRVGPVFSRFAALVTPIAAQKEAIADAATQQAATTVSLTAAENIPVDPNDPTTETATPQATAADQSETATVPPTVQIAPSTSVLSATSPASVAVTQAESAPSFSTTANTPSQALEAMEQMGENWKNRAIALRYLMDKGGLTDFQAAAIVGNACVEAAGCELDPTIEQKGGGPGRGIVQWGNYTIAYDRFGFGDEGLEKVGTLRWYAAQHDTSWDNLETQLGFIVWELNNSERRAGDALRKSTNVYAATDIILNQYERPAERIATLRLHDAIDTLHEYHVLLGTTNSEQATNVSNDAQNITIPSVILAAAVSIPPVDEVPVLTTTVSTPIVAVQVGVGTGTTQPTTPEQTDPVTSVPTVSTSSAPTTQPSSAIGTTTLPSVTTASQTPSTSSTKPSRQSKSSGTAPTPSDTTTDTATPTAEPTGTQTESSDTPSAPSDGVGQSQAESTDTVSSQPEAANPSALTVSLGVGSIAVGQVTVTGGGEAAASTSTAKDDMAKELGVSSADLQQASNPEGAAYYVLDATARKALQITWPAWKSEHGFPVGQCTDFVALKLGSSGNILDKWPHPRNASNWAADAISAGMSVNDTPKAGDVLQWDGGSQYAQHKRGHVAFIEKVFSDGTMVISEGNFDDHAGVRSRTVTPAEYASYGKQVHIIHF